VQHATRAGTAAATRFKTRSPPPSATDSAEKRSSMLRDIYTELRNMLKINPHILIGRLPATPPTEKNYT
jgi:hypothetical protein